MEGMSSFADLLELQDIDANLDRLAARRRSLPEIAEQAAALRAADEAARELDGAVRRRRSVDRDVDRVEDELQMAEQKLGEQERRLFAGGMSAREAQNMRSEVATLRRRVAAMEDELLELLDQREGMEEEERTLGENAGSAAAAERRLASRLAESRATIDASVERYRRRRTETLPGVSPELLRLYARLRERRGGIVVGETSGRVCGACHLQMSIAEYEEVSADRIPQCIHCAAILVL